MARRAHNRGTLRPRSVLGDPGARSGPMMTPMVDVVLVILIFFMGSATIAGQEWFLRGAVRGDETPPDRGTASGGSGAVLAIPEAVIEIRVAATDDGARVLGLGGGALTLGAASDRIAALELGDPDAVRAVLTGDPGVRVGDLVAVHDALSARGIRVSYR